MKVYDVGLHVLLVLRAASRTPCNPLNLRSTRPCVRSKSACTSFLLAESLPSIGSVAGSAPPQFADFAGTMDSSEFSWAFMPAFPSETFADRPRAEHHRCSLPLETKETSRFSRLECPHMHRFSDSAVFVPALPLAAVTMLPSPCQDRIGTQKR